MLKLCYATLKATRISGEMFVQMWEVWRGNVGSLEGNVGSLAGKCGKFVKKNVGSLAGKCGKFV